MKRAALGSSDEHMAGTGKSGLLSLQIIWPVVMYNRQLRCSDLALGGGGRVGGDLFITMLGYQH